MASENRLYRGTIAVMNETKQRAFRHSIISLQTVAEEEEEESQIASVMYSYGQLSIELPDKEGEEKEGEEEEEGGGRLPCKNIMLTVLPIFFCLFFLSFTSALVPPAMYEGGLLLLLAPLV